LDEGTPLSQEAEIERLKALVKTLKELVEEKDRIIQEQAQRLLEAEAHGFGFETASAVDEPKPTPSPLKKAVAAVKARFSTSRQQQEDSDEDEKMAKMKQDKYKVKFHSNPGRAETFRSRVSFRFALHLRGFLQNGLPTNLPYPLDVVPEECTLAKIIKIAASLLLGIELNDDTLNRLNALGQQALQEDLREVLSIIEPLRLGILKCILKCDSKICEILSGDFSVQLPQGSPKSTPHVFVLQFAFSENPVGNIRRTDIPLRTIFSVLIRGGPKMADLLLPAKKGNAYIFGPKMRKHAKEGLEEQVMDKLQNYLWPLPKDILGRPNNRKRPRRYFKGAYCIFRDDMGN